MECLDIPDFYTFSTSFQLNQLNLKEMKIKKSTFAKVTLLILLALVLGCSSPKNEVYNRLIEHANTVKVVNTHEHQRHPKDLGYKEYNFWTLLSHSYLMADVSSAGGSYFDANKPEINTPEQLWRMNGDYLNYSANTSYYLHFLEGMKLCYGYNEPVFTKEGIEILSEQIAEKYKNYDAWFDTCFQKANFETMFIDQFWNSHNLNIDKKHFTLIFPVNKLVFDIGAAKNIYTEKNEEFVAFKKESGIKTLETLDEYLAFVDFMIQTAIKNGAVGLKNSMAYGRSIDYENVPVERATALFKQAPALRAEEIKALQDFLFHWILDKAAEYNLPVQIHTGYLAGNGNQLDNSEPTKLNNLFRQHPKTRFDIFHGGFPWTGEFVAFGKMFPNVNLNLVWLPQISKNRALVTFNEMLDCVSYNKILWGGDCQLIEETVGSLEFGKQVICEVLAARVSNGQMNEETAKKIISAILRENAIRIFNLEKNRTTLK
jgi:hypothetical protein